MFYSMRVQKIILSLFIFFYGCEKKEVRKPLSQAIYLPSPLVDQPLVKLNSKNLNPLELLPLKIDSQEAENYFNDIIHHPWIARQKGLKILNREIVEDIEKYHSAYKILKDQASQAGQQFPNYEEQNFLTVKAYEEIEKKLSLIPFRFQKGYYEVLMLPPGVYKRFYLEDTELGVPIYLDIKGYDFVNKDKEKFIQEMRDWHLSLLEEKESFHPFNGGFLGRGNRNAHFYDPSHGLATKDRGIYFALFPTEEILFVVYLDAPWRQFEKYQDLLKIEQVE